MHILGPIIYPHWWCKIQDLVRKTTTATNITIKKITYRIEYNKILEGTDDEVRIHLLIDIKCAVIVVEPVSPIQNTPHFMRLFFCENNIRDHKYKTEAGKDHYL